MWVYGRSLLIRSLENFQCLLFPQEFFGVESENHCGKGDGKRGTVCEGAGLVSECTHTHSPREGTKATASRQAD